MLEATGSIVLRKGKDSRGYYQADVNFICPYCNLTINRVCATTLKEDIITAGGLKIIIHCDSRHSWSTSDRLDEIDNFEKEAQCFMLKDIKPLGRLVERLNK